MRPSLVRIAASLVLLTVVWIAACAGSGGTPKRPAESSAAVQQRIRQSTLAIDDARLRDAGADAATG